jgi:integrase/recombinase XerD
MARVQYVSFVLASSSMALRLIRRHLKDCPHSSSRYRRCKCPIHVYGTLGGEKIRKALDQTSWDAATELIHGWTASGEIGVAKEAVTIRDAVSKFFADCEARQLGWEAMRKYRHLLEDRLLHWCEKKGLTNLRQLSVDSLREFRQTWSDSPSYATKNLERVRAFMRFCHQAGWIRQNPALAVKAPKVTHAPTLPFSRAEMKRILDACDEYGGNKDRIRAFVLTMRYSGLRIADAIRLSKTQISRGTLFVRTAKTGQPINVPLPPDCIKALAKIADRSERYFWTGKNIRSAVANWSRYLARVFELAKVNDAHSHRFRDTCAVELLLAGASVEDVATILGNTPHVVAKHYAPWVRERQVRLEKLVRQSWR